VHRVYQVHHGVVRHLLGEIDQHSVSTLARASVCDGLFYRGHVRPVRHALYRLQVIACAHVKYVGCVRIIRAQAGSEFSQLVRAINFRAILLVHQFPGLFHWIRQIPKAVAGCLILLETEISFAVGDYVIRQLHTVHGRGLV